MKRLITLTGLMALTSVAGLQATECSTRQRTLPEVEDRLTQHMRHFPSNPSDAQIKDGNPNPLLRYTPSRNSLLLPNATALTADLYGYLVYSEDSEHVYEMIGWNIVNPTDGQFNNLWVDEYAYSGSPLQSVFIRNNRLCGYDVFMFFGEIYGISYIELDLETGKTLVADEFTDSNNLFMSAAYTPVTDKIYGFTIDLVNGGYKFSTASGADPINTVEHLKAVSDDKFCQSLTYNEYEDMFYGVTRNGDLVEIDRLGNQRVIMHQPVGDVLPYISGLAYTPLRQGYYYNALKDEGSSLYELNPSTGQAQKLFDFPTNEEFASLFCNEEQPVALQRPEIINIDFNGPSTSGNITWQLPATNLAGTLVTDPITYTISVDGNMVTEGNANATDNVTCQFEDLSTGYHTFSLSTSTGDIRGMRSNLVKYIGYDQPQKPTNVVLTETEISWAPVQGGVYDGYIDLDQLQYQVWVDNQLIATTRETSIPCGIDLSLPAKRHHAHVIAESNGILSEPGNAQSIVCGTPYNLPMSWDPTADEKDIFEIIDANQDTYVWFYNDEYNGFIYSWDYSNEPWNQNTHLCDGDDWLIFPPVMCDDATGLYRFSLDVLCFNEWYYESFEIWCGDTPTVDGMSEMLFQSGDINNTEDINFEAFFTINEPKAKYLALRSTSKADYCDAMRVNNFLVEKVGSINGPAAVSNLNALPAEKGELQADITFTLPTLTYSSSSLPVDEMLTAIITADEIITAAGFPGETITVKVATQNGANNISVNCQTAEGLKGMPAQTTVYTGPDTPNAPTDVKIMADEDNVTLHISWTPSLIGMHGGYVDQKEITYYLCESSWFNLEDAIEMGTGITEYTYELNEGSPLQDRWFTIAALDEEGQYSDYAVTMIQAGKPCKLPISEMFENEDVSWAPGATLEDPQSYGWGVGGYEVNPVTDGVCNENGYGFIRQSNSTDPVWLALPRFSTTGVDNPAFTLTAMCGNGYSNIEIYALTNGMSERIKIGEMQGEGWQQQTFVLSEDFKQRGWVEIDLKGTPTIEYGYTLVGAYEIKDYLENDFRMRWHSIPERISIGQKTIAYGKVQNVGSKASQTPDINLTLNNRNYSFEATVIKSLPDILQPGEVAVVEFEITPSADSRGLLTAAATLGADDNMADNERYSETTVLAGRSNVVTDLKARQGDEGVVLTWSAPMSNGNVGFEEEVFAQFSDELSTFRNLDLDRQTRMSFYMSPFYIPVPYHDQPAGWMVWNEIEITDICVNNWRDPVFFAGAGMNSVVAFCPENGEAANDWLISPLVKGGSKISFMAVPAQIGNGPETIEILVSSTDDNPDSFRSIGNISVNGNEWCDYSSTLPDDTRYFALRYASSGMFGVFVDNISYTPDPSDIDYYEIWSDGNMIGTSKTTEYTDTIGSGDGMHTYNVVPVMKSTEKGLLSNTVKIQTSAVEMIENECVVAGLKGQIRLMGFAGNTVEIYAANGMSIVSTTVDTNDAIINIKPGVYIVAIDGKTFKVIVG